MFNKENEVTKYFFFQIWKVSVDLYSSIVNWTNDLSITRMSKCVSIPFNPTLSLALILYLCVCAMWREKVWNECVYVGMRVYPQSHVYELVAHNAIVRSHTSLEWKTNWLEMVCIVVFCTPHSSLFRSIFPSVFLSFYFSLFVKIYFLILSVFTLSKECFSFSFFFYLFPFQPFSLSFFLLLTYCLSLSLFPRESVLQSLN